MFLALNLVLTKKQKFGKCNSSIEHINGKSQTNKYWKSNLLFLQRTRLLKIDKKDYNEIDIYYIAYVTIKKIADYNNINSVCEG